MVCDKRSRLVEEYEAVTARFSAVVERLNTQMLAARPEEYEALLRAADEAHADCERVRLALEHHLRVHRCRAYAPAAASRKVVPIRRDSA